jgi:hypothetical protein
LEEKEEGLLEEPRLPRVSFCHVPGWLSESTTISCNQRGWHVATSQSHYAHFGSWILHQKFPNQAKRLSRSKPFVVKYVRT